MPVISQSITLLKYLLKTLYYGERGRFSIIIITNTFISDTEKPCTIEPITSIAFSSKYLSDVSRYKFSIR